MLADATLVAFIATTDLERARDFYGGVLGLTHMETTEFAAVFNANGTTLRITRVDRVTPAPYTVLGWVVADLDRALDSLKRHGVDTLSYEGLDQDGRGVWTAPGGGRIAWFADSDSNTLSITQLV